ncbi:protein BIG GRAIN 1-like C isoform X2 [Glycine max]|uniref:protein BIG GRAIN 1-like C isoform X2 n=1 Tax=Glycine max TaxID=3847 RepID=UPI001B3572D9|nr:protein BIG GRAIN 1-like C isoform X2 [Glycine max]
MHERSMKEAAGTCPQRRRTPSFSSSLLDAIYRSIDESKSNLHDDQQLGHHHHHDQTLATHSFTSEEKGGKKERMNLRRAVMLEDWMEKYGSSRSLNAQLLNSSSSSSECSSAGGIFSSSETDTTTTTLKKQRPARPTSEKKKKKKKKQDHIMSSEKKNKEGGFARTKLRALKIYGELNQRVKQPISPGSRIASFLSSIFNSQNVKKAKMCYVGAVEDVSFEHKSKSPCFSSTPSSFSRRSCMSKTPSSAKKPNNNGVKRSVRFYPVSVILGEDSEPQSNSHSHNKKCNNIYESESNLTVRKITRSSSIKELKKNTVRGKENATEEAAARGFVKGYRNSDLFELDHLIGAARYQEELPVYETTNLETNKAIASGLCL